MKWLNHSALGIGLGLFLTACQTSPYSAYREIQIGAQKGQVLHVLGNPERTYRKLDTDRWVYHFKEDGSDPAVKEIWFNNGRVVYKDSETSSPQPQTPAKDSDFVPVE